MEKFHSEHDPDSIVPAPKGLTPAEGDEGSAPEGGVPSKQLDFIPWREEPMLKEAISGIGHRHIVKKGKVRQGRPVNITPEISLEPEAEDMEVTPIMDGETVVGFNIACGCGATHEVRFKYPDER